MALFAPAPPRRCRAARPTGPRAPGRVRSFDDERISRLSRDASALLQIISDADPDLILAVKITSGGALGCLKLFEPVTRTGLTYPLANGYGMAMFSRLELLQPTIRFLVDDAIPSD